MEEDSGKHGIFVGVLGTAAAISTERVLRVVLGDDHPLMLRCVRGVLEAHEDIEVVGEATTGPEVLTVVESTQPDVVLLDVQLPDLDGFSCLEAISTRFPGVHVVMLSAFDYPRNVARARQLGARGYLVKSVSPPDLVEAIRCAVLSNAFAMHGVRNGDSTESRLTEREAVILDAVAGGLSNKQIAREFWITEQTVKFHIGNIFRKLNVANRTEAARVFLEAVEPR